jgi:hypothetical protein
VVNPFPVDRSRRGRRAGGHHNPMEPHRDERVGLYRPRVPTRVPRSLSDEQVSEIFARLPSHRDRALVAFYVSTGAQVSVRAHSETVLRGFYDFHRDVEGRPLPRHVDGPQEPEPPQQVHPVGTGRGHRASRRLKVPQVDRDRLDHHAVRVDQPVGLPHIVGVDQSADPRHDDGRQISRRLSRTSHASATTQPRKRSLTWANT